MPKSHYQRNRQIKRSKEKRKYARRNYSDSRDPDVRRFYSSRAWTELSLAYRAANPICERCHARLADSVHHTAKITTELGWSMRLDPAGLMALCAECHTAMDGDDGGQVL